MESAELIAESRPVESTSHRNKKKIDTAFELLRHTNAVTFPVQSRRLPTATTNSSVSGS